MHNYMFYNLASYMQYIIKSVASDKKTNLGYSLRKLFINLSLVFHMTIKVNISRGYKLLRNFNSNLPCFDGIRIQERKVLRILELINHHIIILKKKKFAPTKEYEF